MKFIGILSLLLCCIPIAKSAEPALTVYALYEPGGGYKAVKDVLFDEVIIHVPSDMMPYHLKGDNALPAMPPFNAKYIPPVPASLLALAENGKSYIGNHSDFKLKITQATWDAKTSTIRVKYTTDKKFSQVTAELRVQVTVAFYMVKK